MSYQFYKILHLSSLFLLFLSLGAHALFYILSTKDKHASIVKTISICHGLSLLMALTGGFGLLARLGIMGSFPLWVWAKLAIWLALGGVVVLNKKSNLPLLTRLLIILTLGVTASLLATLKPF